MTIALIVLGFGLVGAGLYFAIGGVGHSSASGSALKGISVEGPSWLILVAIGAGVILFGAWQADQRDARRTIPDTVDDDVFDPVLDALWDECDNGSGAACDELFEQSIPGGNYEWFGATCGGRSDSWAADCTALLD